MYRFLTIASFFWLTAAAVSLPTSFVVIGDSTTSISMGWGNGFCGNEDAGIRGSLEPKTPCFNTAVPSTSTGTFVSKGHWKKSVKIIKEEVAKARRTIVTIQFGHNDRNRGTVESMGRNLTTMVNQIKELKAEPVLVTPLVIRRFGKDGKIADELVPWAEETKTVARETKTHILDLHGASLKYCESLGDEASRRLYSGTGAVHVNNKGKIVFGRMVADLMNADFGLLGINLLPIVPNRELSYNISHGIPSY